MHRPPTETEMVLGRKQRRTINVREGSSNATPNHGTHVNARNEGVGTPRADSWPQPEAETGREGGSGTMRSGALMRATDLPDADSTPIDSSSFDVRCPKRQARLGASSRRARVASVANAVCAGWRIPDSAVARLAGPLHFAKPTLPPPPLSRKLLSTAKCSPHT